MKSSVQFLEVFFFSYFLFAQHDVSPMSANSIEI